MTIRKANREVINQFVSDGPSCPDLNGYGSVKVVNGALYSYRAKVAEWGCAPSEPQDKLVVNAGWDGYSATTSKHMKFLYDALTGNCEAYAYKRDDFDHASGYDDDRPVVPVRVSWDGKGKNKSRWKRLERYTNGAP